jgi:hypothetical protein
MPSSSDSTSGFLAKDNPVSRPTRFDRVKEALSMRGGTARVKSRSVPSK